VVNSADPGFPMNGEWRIKFGAEKPRLESAVQSWRAESAPSMDLEVAYRGQATTARVSWKRLDEDKYDARKSLMLDLASDGKLRAYHLNLAASLEYRGLITGLAIEPVIQPRPGDEMVLKSIVLSADRK